MTLDEWMTLEGTARLGRRMRQREAAQLIDVSPIALSRYLSGRLPEWPVLLRILTATNGRVTPNDFIPASTLQKLRAA